MKKVKVIHVVEGLEEGGVLTFLRNMVNTNPNISFTIVYGLRNELYLSENIKRQFIGKNINFIFWKYAKRKINIFNDFLAFFSLRKILLAEAKKSVIHLHSSKASFIGRMVCFLIGRKKVIYTPHGLSFLSAKGVLSVFFYMLLEKLFSFLPSQIICVSKSESKALRKLLIKSKFIFNGIANLRRKKRKNKNQFVIITSGRITRQKDPETFNAIASLFIKNNKIKFVWVGDGPLKSFLTSKNITITGWLQKDELIEKYNESNLYLSTSLYEGFSFSVLEAMSLALPLVLRECVGNVDMINKENKNGYIFKTVEEAKTYMESYINQPSLLRSQGLASHEFFKRNYVLKSSIMRYRDLYHSLGAST